MPRESQLFSRVLIANRGEIAVRIIRACRELGIETVAVYSDADAAAPHVALADRAMPLGSPAPSESYLAIAKLIDAARRSGAQAVHPGYGFLSESAEFADACESGGLIFIGPPAGVIAKMGSKVAARALMQAHGVPVVPGETPDDQSPAALEAAAARVGYPLLLKPSAGGGGIGMRIVRGADELGHAAEAARREARGAFGDETLYVERLLESARHVEVQVLADAHGRVVHLLERECSLQRRHQKVLEESPSMALTPRLRHRMGEAAVAAARAASYRNAGTIEFLLLGSGDAAEFFFLEMNTRLQVEHPVTEVLTGLDLVHQQLRVAAGEPLAFEQSDVTGRGHAIECRVYAEDPQRDFLPQAGRILLYREPGGPGVRVDSGIAEHMDVPVQYDPLLAKVIVHADTRARALERMRQALRQFVILGIRTNVPYLLRVLAHPAFVAGHVDTRFLDRETDGIVASLRDAVPPPAAKAALSAATATGRVLPSTSPRRGPARFPDPWEHIGRWSPGT